MANIFTIKNPQVRIMFSELMFYNESTILAKAYDPSVTLSENHCKQQTREYIDAWQPKEQKLLSAMQDLFKLNFYNSVIDVTLAPYVMPKSKPLMISFYYQPDQFIDVLCHELLHVLFTDNQYFQYNNDISFTLDIWSKLFGKKDFNEPVHIPVHAGLKALYLDVLHEPYRLKRDIEFSKGDSGYEEAWQYVEKHDYKKIIEKFKNSYSSTMVPSSID